MVILWNETSSPPPCFFVAREITEPLFKPICSNFSLMNNCIIYLSASDQNSVAKSNPYLCNRFCGKWPTLKKSKAHYKVEQYIFRYMLLNIWHKNSFSYSPHVRQCFLLWETPGSLDFAFLGLFFPWLKIRGPLLKAICSFSSLMGHFILSMFQYNLALVSL